MEGSRFWHVATRVAFAGLALATVAIMGLAVSARPSADALVRALVPLALVLFAFVLANATGVRPARRIAGGVLSFGLGGALLAAQSRDPHLGVALFLGGYAVAVGLFAVLRSDLDDEVKGGVLVAVLLVPAGHLACGVVARHEAARMVAELDGEARIEWQNRARSVRRPVRAGRAPVERDAYPLYRDLIVGAAPLLAELNALGAITTSTTGVAPGTALALAPRGREAFARFGQKLRPALEEPLSATRCTLPPFDVAVRLRAPDDPVEVGGMQLASMLRLEGFERATAGDFPGAADSFLDAIRVACDVGEGAGVSLAIEALARLVASRPGRFDLEALEREVTEHLALVPPAGESAALDRILALRRHLGLALEPGTLLPTFLRFPVERPAGERPGVVALLAPGATEVVACHDDLAAQARDECAVKMAEDDERRREFDASLRERAAARRGRVFPPRYDECLAERTADGLVHAWAALARGVFSIERARVAGRPPIGPRLPLDPFARPAAALRYEVAGHLYRVWSASHDHRDDRGRGDDLTIGP